MTLVRSEEEFNIGGSFANAPGVRSPELGIKPDGTLFSVSTRVGAGEVVMIYVEYSADGQVLQERVVPVANFPANEQPDVSQMVALSGGGFVVLYEFGVGSTREPFVQIFDEDGNPEGPPMEVPRSDAPVDPVSQDGYALVADPSGGFSVMIGLDRDNDDVSYNLQPNNLFSRASDVRVVEYDQEGNITAGPYFPHATTGSDMALAGIQRAQSHDSFDDGRTIVAYYDVGFSFNSQGDLRTAPNVTVSILRDGQLLGETIVFEVTWLDDFSQSTPGLPVAGSPGVAPIVTVLEDGGFAVAFQTVDGLGRSWQVQFYDENGDIDGPLIDTGMSDANPEFAALPDGSLAMLATNTAGLPVIVELLILNSDGVEEQVAVDAVNAIPRFDGIDVGPDGSIYVSLRDGTVVRYVQQPETNVGSSASERLNGAAGGDTILGEGGNDTINGRNGNDQLEGGSGRDSIRGEMGADILLGGSGTDTLDGGSGNDVLRGGNENDSLLGQNGNDILTGDNGADTLLGNQGNDQLFGGNQGDLVSGGLGNDLVRGGTGNDTLNGNKGNDTLNGDGGNDLASGGGGNDLVNGGNGNDTLLGGKGADTLNGGQGNDEIFAGNQNDRANGGQGKDLISGGNGNDTLNGNQGNDTLSGDTGNDILNGNQGNDSVSGGNGNDTLNGNQGNDTLNGGNGDDFLIGGQGVDDFVFAGRFGQDTIQGFDATDGREDIDLSDVASITNFADLRANHMSQVGADVLIDAGNGNTITLLNTTLTSLGADDFIF